jgi:hypothetical protein
MYSYLDEVKSSHEPASPVAATSSIPLAGLLEPYGRVYPLGEEKQPLIRRIPKDLISFHDQTRIAQAAHKAGRSGWGFRIESPLLVVFDCEHVYKHGVDKPGPDRSAAFQCFWQAHVESLPEHLMVRTGSGGYHHYFLLPADLVPLGYRLRGNTKSQSNDDKCRS